MPEFHDLFWKSLFQNIENIIEFFRFLFGEKVNLLDFEGAILRSEIYLTKKRKVILDLLLEIPMKNSSEKIFFLIEHKSVKDDEFLNQIHKYKIAILKWQRKEFGKTYPIVSILFSQGLDGWNPEERIAELEIPESEFSPSYKSDLSVFHLQEFDPIQIFQSLELQAGFLLLKQIRKPWDDFVEVWKQILGILVNMDGTKRLDLEERMQDYIFRSRSEEDAILREAIMGKKILTAYERTLERGRLEGKLEGKLEGEFQKAIETARKLLERGFSREEIIDITGLSLEDLEKHDLV
ncbi:MAG: hypothetical protein EBS19_06580 [Spirochaetia bacterium]|nr:hypothetical protein [Spirochaetia bacterium]